MMKTIRVNRYSGRRGIIGIWIAVVLGVFFCTHYTSGGEKALDAAGVAANNRGAALMGQFNYEEARKVFDALVKKYPGNLDIAVNLAISIFNRQKEGDEQTALVLLRDILKQDESNLRARYCAGLLELYRGQPEKALDYLQAVLNADSWDAEASYFVGKTLMQLSRYEEALRFFKVTISLDPYVRSAYYGKIMALRQLGKRDEAMAAMQAFQRMRKNPRARLLEFKYTRMGAKATVRTIDAPNLKRTPKPVGTLFERVKPIQVKQQVKGKAAHWREPEAGQVNSANSGNITVCDINGDGHSDIFVCGALKRPNGFGNALLLVNPENRAYTLENDHPLAAVTDVNAALWGDIDNDGLVDVYLCRNGANQLWMQEKKGQWRQMTPDTGVADGKLNTVDGALFDADHDGDLDVFLVNGNGPNELLNNNRNGTFRPLAGEYGLTGSGTASRSVIITDIDADRDADIVVINQRPPHEVYVNELLWKYTPAKGFDKFTAADIAAAVAGDVDTDGRSELYTLDHNGDVKVWKTDKTGIREEKLLFKKAFATTTAKDRDNAGQIGLALADVEGDGRQDIVVSNGKGWWAGAFESNSINIRFTAAGKSNANLNAWALLNTAKGPAMLGWRPGEAPFVWSPGAGRYPFASLQLAGEKVPDSQWRSNASGIGTRVSVRVGARWTVLDTFRNHSGPGQSLQPVSIGLRGAARIDFVTFDWSDGVFQTELNLEAGKRHRIVETQRQLSSCPVLFAWNGERYEFVSDLLGVGGIGYAVGPGEYAEPRPWENFMLPDGLLQPRDGDLTLKLMEPMEEVAYLDAVRLKAYDLPPGWSMALDERMGISEPAPTGLPVFYRHLLTPVEVINDRNEDVTAVVAQPDLKAAAPGELDDRFIGRLERDHVLTLTFDRALDGFTGQPVLLADGWVEYPYSQTGFAAWQAGADYRAPTVEVRRPDGQWVVVREQFGYPAGMPRRMSLPLPPLPNGVRQIRISTNQEIYWDRLAVVFKETCPQVQPLELKLKTATLELTGFPLRTDHAQRLPYYDYEKRRPFWDTKFLEGYYTRFGGVEELVSVKDNGVAIFGGGEGIHMVFAQPETPVREGWTRIYVLETNGWCKDMDFYTKTGETIEPVPAIGKRSPHVERLHQKYNTRYLSGRE